jgi:hypothetical protein
VLLKLAHHTGARGFVWSGAVGNDEPVPVMRRDPFANPFG